VLYVVIGILRQPSTPSDAAFEAAVNEQLAQPAVRIVNAGYLRDPHGAPLGVMALVDVDTAEQAAEYLEASPFSQQGLYDHVHIGAYDLEVGRV
jgi:uncharacterized protein YciI